MHRPLERADTPFFLFFQGALDGGVETAGREIGGEPCIYTMRIMLVQPDTEFLALPWSERLDCAFNFFNSVRCHVYLRNQLSHRPCTQTRHVAARPLVRSD